jgi:hypothetical protein
MHPLLQKQNTLHSEASVLLEKILLPVLEQYGKVSIGGTDNPFTHYCYDCSHEF